MQEDPNDFRGYSAYLESRDPVQYAKMVRAIKDESFASVPVATEPTVFERCVEAARGVQDNYLPAETTRAITTAVLTALAEHTESPRTVDEVLRVLGEVGA